MSYKEKGELAYLVAVAGTFGAYLVVVLRRAEDTTLAKVPYVSPMLWAIGIGIVLSIVGHITVVAVTAKPRECDLNLTDVRDNDINRFGGHIGGIVLAAAMVVPFGLALAGAEHFWIANAMYAAFVGSTVAGAGVKLFAYRRGI